LIALSLICEQVLVYEESEYNSLTEDAVTEAQVSATEDLIEKLTLEVQELFRNVS